MASSLILTGGAATTKTLKEEIAQTAHGFTVGSVLRWDYSQGKYALAKADTALNAEVVGVVNELSDANNFYLTYSGYIEIPTLSGVSHPVLFLSGTTAGELSSSPPSFIGSVVKPVLSRSTNGAGHIVMNYLGTQIGGSSTVAIDEIQPVGSVMPFAGDAIPDTWLECNGVSYAVSDYAELYEKLRYASGDRLPMYGYITQISVNTTTYSTWFSSVSVGDRIAYSPTQSDLTQNIVTQYSLLGKVIAKGSGSITVQVYPTYSISLKKFVFPNVIPSSVGWIAAFAPDTYFYDSLTSTNRRANAAGQSTAAVGATSVTHFNTPDLRARFPVGVNTSAIVEDENDTTYNSALSAFALGEEGGSESLGTIINVATWNATSAESAVPSGSAVIKPPYLATKYIIKAKPYTRAAIVDGVDIPYSQLLVRDLRSRNVGGSNGDLAFYTNIAGDSGSGTERMRLTRNGLRIVQNDGYTCGINIIGSGNSGSSSNSSIASFLKFYNPETPINPYTWWCPRDGIALSVESHNTNEGAIINEYSTGGLGNPLFTVTSVGNVGIGNSNPGASLDVNGTLNVNGTIKHKNPAFFVTTTAADIVTTKQINYTTLIFSTISINDTYNGVNVYNASTGVFTAPITGRYYFSARILFAHSAGQWRVLGSNGGGGGLNIVKNFGLGAGLGEASIGPGAVTPNETTVDLIHLQVNTDGYANLTAGDTVRVVYFGKPFNESHNCFGGYFIG